MPKVVVTRTPEEKAAAKRRFGARIGELVERSMYLEGQAVPPENKSERVIRMRASGARDE